MQPVREAPELAQLLGVFLCIALGVIAHEHLREIGIEALNVLAELVPVLEVEHVLARTLGRHCELQPLGSCFLRDRAPELLVHEHTGHRGIRSRGHGSQQTLEDQVLGVGDHRGLFRVGVALDPEELLLEGASVVEREDVELLLVAELHRSVSFICRLFRLAAAPARTLAGRWRGTIALYRRETLAGGPRYARSMERCPQAPICSLSARSVARRSVRTSPSVLTADTGSGAGRQSCRAIVYASREKARCGEPRWAACAAARSPACASIPRRTPRSPW